MPTAVPPIGYTATLTVNDGVSSADQAFSFPIMIDCPSGDVSKVDASYMGMPTKDKLYIPGLFDNGTFQFEQLYCEADWRRLLALRGVSKTWKITFPDDGTGTPPVSSFSGFLTKYPTKFEMEAIPHIQCEIQISGAITTT